MSAGLRDSGRFRAWASGLVVAMSIGTGVVEAFAQAGSAALKEDAAAHRLDEWKRAAAEYSIRIDSEPPVEPKLRPEPALRWTNPLRETDDGLVFLWLADGRPAVAASIFRYRRDGKLNEAHEFHSFAPAGLTMTRAGRTLWSPTAPGVTFAPIPEAPRPAGSPAGRLRQLRALAGEFTAFVDTEAGRTELRLLSQPIYRDEAARTGSPDGALFAFVLATDPEALLRIESRPGPAGAGPAWHYAFARMTTRSLSARHKGREAWRVDVDPDSGNPAKPYCTLWNIEPRP